MNKKPDAVVRAEPTLMGMAQVKDMIRGKEFMDALTRALPSMIEPERWAQIAVDLIWRTPKLRECTQLSLFGSLLTAAELGLVTDGITGQAYLIPFRSKRGYLAQLVVGYRGHCVLAYRSGKVAAIEARLVYRCDHFDVRYGTDSGIVHVPNFSSDDYGGWENVAFAYSVAHVQGSSRPLFHVMTRKQLNKIRAPKAGIADSSWATHPEEMSLKSPISRLCKIAPFATDQMQRAAALTELAEGGIAQDHSAIARERLGWEAAEQGKAGRLDALAGQLEGGEESEDAPPISPEEMDRLDREEIEAQQRDWSK